MIASSNDGCIRAFHISPDVTPSIPSSHHFSHDLLVVLIVTVFCAVGVVPISLAWCAREKRKKERRDELTSSIHSNISLAPSTWNQGAGSIRLNKEIAFWQHEQERQTPRNSQAPKSRDDD